MPLNPASEVILHHLNDFKGTLLFAGNLPDRLPTQWYARDIRVHTSQYHHWRSLHPVLGNKVQFGLLAEADFISPCHTLVYYWPKSRQEAQFQLYHLLSQLPVHTDLFIVGENRGGVRSAKTTLSGIADLIKRDSARRCSLWYGHLEKQPEFNLNTWWGGYHVDDIPVKTLPGVFSYGALDAGSQLLLSSFIAQPMQGKILDIGCGSGVLATVLAKKSSNIILTLSDVHAGALAASHATLAANQLTATVTASDVYSDITGRFDFIIANPPFHDGLRTSLHTAEKLIDGAAAHLQPGGSLRIVANAFLPYPALLDAAFGSHEILAQTGRFKVCQATVRRR